MTTNNYYIMKTVKHISRPDLKSARKLTPLEMNEMRCDRKHSLLSRARLDQISAASPAQPESIIEL